jgi:hypothetical protein
VTATLSTAQYLLKRRYDDGRFPKTQIQKFECFDAMPKDENWDGDDFASAFQLEGPQGVGASFSLAQSAISAGTYRRFLPTRIEYFGLCRVRGHAYRAAQKSSGSFVNLWVNEMEGCEEAILKMLEIYMFGNGSASLGAATFSTTTATLSTIQQIVNFDLGGTYGGQSDGTLTATLRSGSIKVTGIDHGAGTLTAATNWTTTVVGLQNSDHLTRYADQAVANTAVVPIGLTSWVVGGSSPGSLWGYNRNEAPLRTAGQNYNATGVTYNDAVNNAEALLGNQGYSMGRRLVTHPQMFADWKKTTDGKVIYQRGGGSGGLTVGTSDVGYDGIAGYVSVKTSPFATYNGAYIGNWQNFRCASLGPAPHLARDDNQEVLRVANDDAIEARYRMFGNFLLKSPNEWIRITNFGA